MKTVNSRQMFLDESLMDESQNIRLAMNRPATDGKLLLEPCEEELDAGASFGAYSSLLHDNGTFRLWYFVNNTNDIHKRRLCYAESKDGLNFIRPKLDPRSNNGLKPGNAVIGAPIQGGCVWLDPKAEPERRYRTQAKWGPPDKDKKNGSSLHFYASPDGFKWTETHHLHMGDCDTQVIIFYDDSLGRYVMYNRAWIRFEDHNLNHRKVRRLESDDLIDWDNERIVWEADADDLAMHRTSVGAPPVDCYGACVFKYPEAGDFYIMLAQHYWHWYDRPDAERWGNSPDPENMKKRMVRLGPATIDARLGYSRNGTDFSRAGDRGPFLGVGPEGHFDSRMIWMLPNPVIRRDDIWFYYYGTNRAHDGVIDPAADRPRFGIGRAVMRRDGFVSADADRRGGSLTTPLLLFEKGVLTLNVSASGGGYVRVEMLDREGRLIKGFSGNDSLCLNGDSVRLPVRWKGGGIDRLAGHPVRIKFNLVEAKLYGFQVIKN